MEVFNIGTFIWKTLGYAVQFFVLYEIFNVTNPKNILLIKSGTKFGIKLIKSTSKNYARTVFKSDTIFSDAIDASFFAD